MSSMNLATQKRLGVLPKTEDTLSYKGHTYGNTHRGFGLRRPTPIASNKSPGFFGVHGLGAAAGDGKLHYFGNGPGQADLPSMGFYGLGNTAMDFQVADMMIADPTENKPTNPAGIYGLMDGSNPQLGALLVLGALGGVATKKVDKKMGAVVGLLGAYIMTTNLNSF